MRLGSGLVLAGAAVMGHGRVSEFCYFVTFAVAWPVAERSTSAPVR